MTDICASELFSNQTICEVINKLDDLSDQAIAMRDLATAAIAQIGTENEAAITDLNDITYSANTASVDKTYVAPTVTPAVPDLTARAPTAPTLPTAPTIGSPEDVGTAPTVPDAYVVPTATQKLIEEADFDAAYAREAARLARISVRRERDAQYAQSAKGLGLPAAAITMALADAQEETNRAVNQVAQDKVVGEAEMLRDDVKYLHDAHIRNWPLRPDLVLRSYEAEEGLEVEAFRAGETAKSGVYGAATNGLTNLYNAQVQAALGVLNNETSRYNATITEFRAQLEGEAQRRGWSELQLRDILEQADKATVFAIQKAQIIAELARETEQATAQLLAGITQAIYSSASYHLGGSGAQTVSE